MDSYVGMAKQDTSHIGASFWDGVPSKAIRCIMGAFFAVALFADVFIAPFEDYAYKRTKFLAENWLLLLLGGLIVLLVLRNLTSERGKSLLQKLSQHEQQVDRIVLATTLVLLVVQIVAVHSYVFISGWDSGRLTQDSWRLANHNGFNAWYYSNCPNNLLILRLAQLCMKVAIALGATRPIGGVFVFAVLNCLVCALALLSLYHVLRRVASLGCALAGWLLGVLLIWLSPWVSILYSDPITLAMPVFGLALMLEARHRSGWRRLAAWGVLGFLSYVMFQIKPQQIFLLGAVVLVEALEGTQELVHGDCERRRLVLMQGGKLLCGTLVGVALAFCAVSATTGRLARKLDPNAGLGWTHYLMMGLNAESGGGYNGADAAYSRSFEDDASRRAANFAMIQERLEKLGFGGTAHLLLDKLLTNYNDGTFAWPLEGHFMVEDAYWSDDLLSPLTCTLYHPETDSLPEGVPYRVWITSEQALWLVVLFLCAFGLLSHKGSHTALENPSALPGGDRLYVETVVTLSLMMLSGFELLFEARARYLYSFSTFYVLLAALGAEALCHLALSRGERQIHL